MIRLLCSGVAIVCLAGCSFYARGPNDYKDVTRQLVQTRSSVLQDCYEREIALNEKAGGDVAVRFDVEAKTGKVLSPSVLPAHTTASEGLQQCVVTALDGLVLEPPDQRTAQAQFVWSFKRS